MANPFSMYWRRGWVRISAHFLSKVFSESSLTMRNIFRRLMRVFILGVKNKIRWTINEYEAVKEVRKHLGKENATFNDVENFLFDNGISHSTQLLNDVPVIVCNISGPTLWSGIYPFGSMYTVIFYFSNDVVSDIEANLMKLHF
jgi:hypothetical protein